MKNAIDVAINVDMLSDVVLDEAEAFIPQKVSDVPRISRNQVVNRCDVKSLGKKSIAKV